MDAEDILAMILILGIPGVILVIFLFFPILMWKSYKCDSRWEHSGVATDYGYIKGCVVKDSNGNWVPENAYKTN